MKHDEPIRQHYVPKLYLKRFAIKNNKKYEIYTYDKSKQNLIKTKIENVALENNFYTDENLSDKYYLEKYFGKKIEPIIGSCMRKLIKICTSYNVLNNDYLISDELKKDFSYIIIFQLLRGKHTFEYGFKLAPVIAKDMEKEIIQEFENVQLSMLDHIIEEVCQKKFVKNVLLEQLFNNDRIDRLAEVLFEKAWIIYVFPEDCLLTNDEPVIVRNSKTDKTKLFNVGLIKDHTEVYYAITPRILICLYGEHTFLKSGDRMIRYVDDKKFVNYYNRIVLESCNAQVYSNDEELINSTLKCVKK